MYAVQSFHNGTRTIQSLQTPNYNNIHPNVEWMETSDQNCKSHLAEDCG